jgi:hypothetical protein
MLDRHTQPRLAAPSPGRLISRDGRCNRSCTIKDLSEDGASLSAMDLEGVPQHVYLFVESSGELFECDVSWQRADEMGVRIVDTATRHDRLALLRLSARSPVG